MEKFCWKLSFVAILRKKIACVFWRGQTLYWPYLRNGWSDWCEIKRKWIDKILVRLYEHIHDLDIEVSKSEFETGMGRPIDMEQKGCESSIHDHDMDLCVAIMRLVDVLESNWDDFRCRHTIDISSRIYEMLVRYILSSVYLRWKSTLSIMLCKHLHNAVTHWDVFLALFLSMGKRCLR